MSNLKFFNTAGRIPHSPQNLYYYGVSIAEAVLIPFQAFAVKEPARIQSSFAERQNAPKVS